jgi:hypothetical protein
MSEPRGECDVNQDLIRGLRNATHMIRSGRNDGRIPEQHKETIRTGLTVRGDPFGHRDILILEADTQLLKIPFEKLPATLGTGKEADYSVSGVGISRKHLRLCRKDHFVMIQDMNSKNGTYLNGRRIETDYLCSGDEVSLGNVNLTVRRG